MKPATMLLFLLFFATPALASDAGVAPTSLPSVVSVDMPDSVPDSPEGAIVLAKKGVEYAKAKNWWGLSAISIFIVMFVMKAAGLFKKIGKRWAYILVPSLSLIAMVLAKFAGGLSWAAAAAVLTSGPAMSALSDLVKRGVMAKEPSTPMKAKKKMDSFFFGFADEFVKLSASKTYPFSRFLTSSYNPYALFGTSRFVGSRGLMGRIAKGRVMEQDRNSIAKILEGTGLSGEKAMGKAEKIIAESKAGKFKHMKKFPISRFFTSRAAMGGLSGVTSGAQWAGAGGMAAGPAGAVLGGALGGGTAAANTAIGTHLHRIVGPRGLAGRIAKGKKLTQNENNLLSMINAKPKLRERLKNAVDAMKGK